MSDQSYLDKKYFIDNKIYNCPFCNRNHVTYSITWSNKFNWTENKKCYIHLIECHSCHNISMHLSFNNIVTYSGYLGYKFNENIDLDSEIFYSVPTSFFTIDDRIPAILRELISEAEGCLKMNYLTGASVCMRKTIYEFTIKENAEGKDYESKIKFLKNKYPEIDPTFFDILAQIKDMTSDKIHEQSWDKWNSSKIKLIIETLKSIFYDIYVIPLIKKESSIKIQELLKNVKTDKKATEI
ncbi:MAG: hypothetical protein ABSG15_15500 [FCB group bacterium]|jgi:transcription elongation factor Elf1